MEDHFQTLNYLALFNAESSNTPILTILSTKKKKKKIWKLETTSPNDRFIWSRLGT